MTTNIDLLRKYNVPGPRYTSYPTVPYWETSPSEAQWIASVEQALAESDSQGVGAAMYVHLPFCQSLCNYCGCNTRITRNRGVSAPYVETVLKEWALYRGKLAKLRGESSPRKILLSELHLGGGTPTFLSAAELERLITGVRDTVELTSDAEFGLEADPRVTTREQLEVLARLGFKRLSLGIQDFDPRVQDIVNRVQSEEQVRAITEAARELGYTSINYDLIYGLPLQTRESVRATVDAVRRLRPDRIAFYAYAHVPWIKPGQRRFTEADLPEGDEKRALYELGREMLENVGYREVGMDHFALETDGLWKAAQEGTLHRNFMGYTPRFVAPLIGLGVSAISDSWRQFAQNEKLLETYVSRVDKGEIPVFRGHVLDTEDQVVRRHVLNLMTQMRTRWDQPDLATEYLAQVPEKLREFVSDGLLDLSEKAVTVTEAGRPFLRNICMAFDARLARKAPSTQLFSKTI